jgi:hypothetical protein
MGETRDGEAFVLERKITSGLLALIKALRIRTTARRVIPLQFQESNFIFCWGTPQDPLI